MENVKLYSYDVLAKQCESRKQTVDELPNMSIVADVSNEGRSLERDLL